MTSGELSTSFTTVSINEATTKAGSTMLIKVTFADDFGNKITYANEAELLGIVQKHFSFMVREFNLGFP